MEQRILELLEEDARYTVEELATMTGYSTVDVAACIDKLVKSDIIRGYKTVIDWDKVDDTHVTALIEVNVTPQADAGFEELAERISGFDCVESLYLMSGAYDFCVIVRGQTFQKIAMFVAKRLATINGVTSTGTHFVLRKYKDFGVEMHVNKDDRGNLSL